MPTLAKKEYCTGCTACASACPQNCIVMAADENGFLVPVINTDECISCGMCEKACPIVTQLKALENEPKAYAAYSKDEEIRMQSSSGGVFTEIAKHVLQNGGIVFGAAYDEQFNVIHIAVDNERDLEKLRGAKYAQSDLRGAFVRVEKLLKDGRRVLFSGTPCQVGGLKAFLQKEYENLLTVDFVCHSVPSPMAWREYVKYRAVKDNSGEMPEMINLRSKITGWSRYRYSNVFEYKNGCSHVSKSGESLYMKLFVGGYISRECCKNCKFKGYSRSSDLTLGDFWGVWDIVPEMDDDKGTSVMLVHSENGEKLLAEIGSTLALKEVSLEETSRENSAMLKTAAVSEKREEILVLIRNGEISECHKLFAAEKTPITVRVKRLVKRVLKKVLGK